MKETTTPYRRMVMQAKNLYLRRTKPRTYVTKEKENAIREKAFESNENNS